MEDKIFTAGSADLADLLDKRVLSELLETLSADGFANRIGMFKMELELLGPILKGLQDERDWDRVAKIAHKNAGGAALFGATRLSHALGQVEVAARTGQTQRLDALIIEAASLADLTVKALSLSEGVVARATYTELFRR